MFLNTFKGDGSLFVGSGKLTESWRIFTPLPREIAGRPTKGGRLGAYIRRQGGTSVVKGGVIFIGTFGVQAPMAAVPLWRRPDQYGPRHGHDHDATTTRPRPRQILHGRSATPAADVPGTTATSSRGGESRRHFQPG